MREVKRRSAGPVYIAAAVFAVYALVLPLYSLVHFLIAALVTAGAWLLADRLFKPTVEYIPEPEPEPVSYGGPTDAILAEAATARREMERLSSSIEDKAIRDKIAALLRLSDRIAQDAVDDPADVPQIQKFQRYFLPSTLQLLNAYDRMSALGVEGENITGTKDRIGQMLDTAIAAFEKQLDALYQNDAMDIDTDIQLMERLLAREGLAGDDGFREILRRSEG